MLTIYESELIHISFPFAKYQQDNLDKNLEITASVIDFWPQPSHCNIDYLSRDLNCMQISVWTRKRSQFPIGGSHCAVTD